ncbi:MAG: hypothetical protein WKF73_16145 [Nocardioidaceae bacterium]
MPLVTFALEIDRALLTGPVQVDQVCFLPRRQLRLAAELADGPCHGPPSEVRVLIKVGLS